MMQLLRQFEWNRNELAGAFGDIGTDLPLIIAYLLVSDAHAASILIVFGILQIVTAFVYRIPMPVQPLKLVAAIAISEKLSSDLISAGALLIGIIMLLLTLSGFLLKLQKIIPKLLIRAIQFGLGLKLLWIAIVEYILPFLSVDSFFLLIISLIILYFFLASRSMPAALLIILCGIIYNVYSQQLTWDLFSQWQWQIPQISTVKLSLMDDALILFVAAQIPLSLGNSIFATEHMIRDYFPDKKISVQKIGFTYAVMNVFTAFSSGFPVCHGSGGMAGHIAFGARTGSSVIIYGLFYIFAGTFFSHKPEFLFALFPMIILGIILSVEAVTLTMLSKDMLSDKREFIILIILAIIAAFISYGFLIIFVLAFFIHYFIKK